MIAILKSWAFARLAPLLLGASVAGAVLVWDQLRINRAEQRGEDRANINTERQNAEIDEIGQRGSSHGGMPVAGSVRDPRYRD